MDHTFFAISQCQVNFFKTGSTLFVFTAGIFDDQALRETLKELAKALEPLEPPVTRVWDDTGIAADGIRLTHAAIAEAIVWAKELAQKKPGSMLYAIGSKTLSYGMARMYEIRSDEKPNITVLKSYEDLPHELQPLYLEAKAKRR